MESKIYLNTWGAYNNGCIGYGWMTPEEAREFIASDPERDGGEWFAADIDNYTGLEFRDLEYWSASDIIDILDMMNEQDEEQARYIAALAEYNGGIDSAEELTELIDKLGNYYMYDSVDDYYAAMDELIDECEGNAPELLTRYFDYDAYHRDLMFDAYEAENGVVIVA